MNKLPEQCYNTLRSTGELVTIRKNEKGYFPSELSTPGYVNKPGHCRAGQPKGWDHQGSDSCHGRRFFVWMVITRRESR